MRIIFIAGLMILASAGEAEQKVTPTGTLGNLWRQDTLSNGLFGLGRVAAETGIEVSLGVTHIYQQNMRGGLSTHDRSGRLTGSYDLEINGDLDKLMGMKGARIYVHAEGGWPRAAGIDEQSGGSFMGINDDAHGHRSIDITELWYEQKLLQDELIIRIGKLDLTGGFEHHGWPVSFDGSLYANDETTQFLNSALVNNPTIPFPDYALGMVLYYNPVERWYISIAAADAQNDFRETGFRTALHDEDYFMYVAETGYATEIMTEQGELTGMYRIGIWYDPQDKERLSGEGSKRDDAGLYVSCEQMFTKENDDPQDSQGLGAFARYGWAPSVTNELTNFWSTGLQYRGLLPGRDDDVLAGGIAQGIFSDQSEIEADTETIFEVYYNIQAAGWLQITPSLQYIADPAGDGSAGDAVVAGLRAQMSF